MLLSFLKDEETCHYNAAIFKEKTFAFEKALKKVLNSCMNPLKIRLMERLEIKYLYTKFAKRENLIKVFCTHGMQRIAGYKRQIVQLASILWKLKNILVKSTGLMTIKVKYRSA